MRTYRVFYWVERKNGARPSTWSKHHLGEVEGDDAADALDTAKILENGETGKTLCIESDAP